MLFAVGQEQQAGRSDHSLGSGVYPSYLTKERTYIDRTKQKMGTDRQTLLPVCCGLSVSQKPSGRTLAYPPKNFFLKDKRLFDQ